MIYNKQEQHRIRLISETNNSDNSVMRQAHADFRCASKGSEDYATGVKRQAMLDH